VDVRAEWQEAAARVEPGGRLVGATPLTGGVSAEVVRLDIATPPGATRRVVYRRHRTHGVKRHARRVTAKEFHLLVALHARGVAVPEPYAHVRAGEDDEGYLLVEWIDGSTDVAAHDLPSALDQMSEFLVRLHSLEPGALGVDELEPIEDPVAAMPAHLPDTPAGRLVQRALRAGALHADIRRPVVLHGDYWPGNVMWRDGRLVAVVDWEDACLGSPLADLATARVELLCRYGAGAMQRFTERYLGSSPPALAPLPAGLALWDLYVAAAALSAMGGWGLPKAEEALRRERTQAFFEDAAAALDAWSA